MESKNEIRLYLDNLQRLIMGEVIEETSESMVVKNPMILHIESLQGKINIQFFPVMFREFQADKDEPTIWDVCKKNITPCKAVTLDARLISQYKHIFAPIKNMPMVNMGQPPSPMGQPVPQAPAANPSVIKLFDE